MSLVDVCVCKHSVLHASAADTHNLCVRTAGQHTWAQTQAAEVRACSYHIPTALVARAATHTRYKFLASHVCWLDPGGVKRPYDVSADGANAGQPVAQQPRIELPEQNLYRDRRAGARTTFG